MKIKKSGPVGQSLGSDLKRKIAWFIVSLVGLIVLLYFQSLIFDSNQQEKNNKQPRKFTIKEGDILFQQTTGELADVIKSTTFSDITHCGIVHIKDGKILVLEAGNTVKFTPLKEWISKGKDKKTAVLRVRDISKELMVKVLAESEKHLEKPYDYKYLWSDEEFYCSELVYKAFERGADIKIGGLVPLRELNYKNSEEFIRKLTGELPLDREIITPVDMYRSTELEVIYDDFLERPND